MEVKNLRLLWYQLEGKHVSLNTKYSDYEGSVWMQRLDESHGESSCAMLRQTTIHKSPLT